MWESNPPGKFLTPHTGFEDRRAHQRPSIPTTKNKNHIPNKTREIIFNKTDKEPITIPATAGPRPSCELNLLSLTIAEIPNDRGIADIAGRIADTISSIRDTAELRRVAFKAFKKNIKERAKKIIPIITETNALL